MDDLRQMRTRRCAELIVGLGVLVASTVVLTMPGSSVAADGWSIDGDTAEEPTSGPRFRDELSAG